MSPKERIFGLDLLRASAVLLVIFHHSLSFLIVPAWVVAYGWLGEIGVGALLLLSGYLIGQGLIKKSKDGRFSGFRHLGQFYLRRWSRTFPPYYFYLFMMAALFPPVIQQLMAHKEYFFFLQNLAWDTPPFYCQTWTLALLEFFYLLFPLLLILTSKFIRNYLVCLIVPMAALFFIPLALRALHTQIEPCDRFDKVFRTWIIYRLDTPIIGVAAALVQAEIPLLWAWFLRRSWIGFSAFSGICLYHWLGCPGLFSSHWLQVFFYPLSALAMAPMLPFLCDWKFNRSLLGSAISSVSQASYSLYVSHFFAFIIGFCLLAILGIPHDQTLLACPIYLLLVGFITCVSYYVTEEPFIRLREIKSSSYISSLYNLSPRTIRTFFAIGPVAAEPPAHPLADQPPV